MWDPNLPALFISATLGGENRLEVSWSTEHPSMPLEGLLCRLKVV